MGIRRIGYKRCFCVDLYDEGNNLRIHLLYNPAKAFIANIFDQQIGDQQICTGQLQLIIRQICTDRFENLTKLRIPHPACVQIVRVDIHTVHSREFFPVNVFQPIAAGDPQDHYRFSFAYRKLFLHHCIQCLQLVNAAKTHMVFVIRQFHLCPGVHVAPHQNDVCFLFYHIHSQTTSQSHFMHIAAFQFLQQKNRDRMGPCLI